MTRLYPYAFLRTGTLAAAGLALAAVGTVALAAPSASSAIAPRQANFKGMGRAMKTLKDQSAGGGGGTVDRAVAVAAAKTIAVNARTQKTMFPAGSGPLSGVKTDALPAVWGDRADFDAQMSRLAAEADRLMAAAQSGNASALNAQFRETGKVCAACHRHFRADS